MALTIPVMTIVVAYRGMLYGSLFVVIIAMVSLYSAYLDVGAFSVGTIVNNIININFFMLAHISVMLTAGALFEERKENLINLQTRVDEELTKNRKHQMLMFQQSRLAQMGELMAMIAHQWGQPLNNLSLNNQLLISRYKKGNLDNAALEEFRYKSQKIIENMSETIEDFRKFYKTDREKYRFSINGAVGQALEILKNTVIQDNIDVSVNVKEEYFGYGYPNEFSQSVLNILNNAKDAMRENNIDNKQIIVNYKKIDSLIEVSIEDNAGGVPDKIIDEIFEPYFSTKKSTNGTGLGLYMAKLIISEHFGGDISVSNTVKGAKFIITLPEDQEK